MKNDFFTLGNLEKRNMKITKDLIMVPNSVNLLQNMRKRPDFNRTSSTYLTSSSIIM